MVSRFDIQVKVASKLGVEPTKLLTAWITEVMKEIGMPVSHFWETATPNRGAPRCPAQYRVVIEEVLREGEES